MIEALILGILLSIVLIQTAVVIVNVFTAPRLSPRFPTSTKLPQVSVLIPARNEEISIEKAFRSVMGQSYPHLDLIILDDNSTDGTAHILKNVLGEKHPHPFTLMLGKPLPSGWSGKNWACHQLAQAAQGEYLLFLDADVTLSDPHAINSMVQYTLEQKVDLLSVFPTQEVISLTEKLTIPLINWFLLSLLPLRLVLRATSSYFSAAVGQVMLWRADEYHSLEGHHVVAPEPIEDVLLAHKAKAAGKKVAAVLDDGVVSCRMYPRPVKWWWVHIRNLSFLFRRGWFFPFLIGLLAIANCWWIYVLQPGLLLPAICLLLGQRLLVAYLSRQSLLDALVLAPWQMVVLFGTIGSALRALLNKNVVWRGRVLNDLP